MTRLDSALDLGGLSLAGGLRTVDESEASVKYLAFQWQPRCGRTPSACLTEEYHGMRRVANGNGGWERYKHVRSNPMLGSFNVVTCLPALGRWMSVGSTSESAPTPVCVAVFVRNGVQRPIMSQGVHRIEYTGMLKSIAGNKPNLRPERQRGRGQIPESIIQLAAACGGWLGRASGHTVKGMYNPPRAEGASPKMYRLIRATEQYSEFSLRSIHDSVHGSRKCIYSI